MSESEFEYCAVPVFAQKVCTDKTIILVSQENVQLAGPPALLKRILQDTTAQFGLDDNGAGSLPNLGRHCEHPVPIAGIVYIWLNFPRINCFL